MNFWDHAITQKVLGAEYPSTLPNINNLRLVVENTKGRKRSIDNRWKAMRG